MAAALRWHPDQVDLATLAGRIAALGYRPRPLGPDGRADRGLLLRFGAAAMAAIAVMGLYEGVYAGWWYGGMDPRFAALFRWTALVLSTPVALWCAGPLLMFSRLTRPALWLMNGCGNALVRLIGVRPAGEAGRVHSAEELSLLVREASESGQIRADTGRMLGNVFALSRTRVRDVMVPRLRVFAVPRGIGRDELLDRICEEGYTRLPVYDGSIDRVIGVLHAKDVFHLVARTRAVVLEDAIRPVLELPPDLPILAALARFRRARQHLALVRAADGPLLGIVTLEDVLEEIVGEIEDEHDVAAPALAPARDPRLLP